MDFLHIFSGKALPRMSVWLFWPPTHYKASLFVLASLKNKVEWRRCEFLWDRGNSFFHSHHWIHVGVSLKSVLLKAYRSHLKSLVGDVYITAVKFISWFCSSWPHELSYTVWRDKPLALHPFLSAVGLAICMVKSQSVWVRVVKSTPREVWEKSLSSLKNFP